MHKFELLSSVILPEWKLLAYVIVFIEPMQLENIIWKTHVRNDL